MLLPRVLPATPGRITRSSVSVDLIRMLPSRTCFALKAISVSSSSCRLRRLSGSVISTMMICIVLHHHADAIMRDIYNFVANYGSRMFLLPFDHEKADKLFLECPFLWSTVPLCRTTWSGHLMVNAF